MASKLTSRSAASGPWKTVTVKLQPDQLSAVDAWREQQPDNPSRAEAIVRLAAKALTTAGAH